MKEEIFNLEELERSLRDVKCTCNYVTKAGPYQGKVCGRTCMVGKIWCKKHHPERMKKRNESKAKKRLKKRTKLLKQNKKVITISKKDNKGNKINKDITSMLEALKI